MSDNKENIKELPKAYEPGGYEQAVYNKEEASGFFNPDKKLGQIGNEPFSIVLPPPNVTGTLHVGHATMLAIEDILTRFNRMNGQDTLWVPGLDHAAIATQNVVEKKINKGLWVGKDGAAGGAQGKPVYAKGTTRHDLGREKFLSLINEFVEESKTTIHRQTRKMGASLDWGREAYTMDTHREHAVQTVFKMMYNDGLIYRGNRIVNWCPRCASTLANDEVVYKKEKAPFYYFKYGPVVIGTARPETKFLDKVIVVHPSDKRYKKLVGKKFDVEWIDGKVKAQVIADIAADPEFGTGAMTITPAHDMKDFEIAEKHGLEIVQIIDEKGKLTSAAGELAGMDAHEARTIIVKRLQEKGLVEKIEENYEHNLSVCYRCGSHIEPLIKEQWFIGVNKKFKFRASTSAPIKGIKNGQKITLKELMAHVVKTHQVNIVPKHFEKTYFYWIDNLRDWCISRQIWFGHQVPVWYKGKDVIVGEAPGRAGWAQDNDTLDTWFSSGLWTFSTLGWPCPKVWFVRHGEAQSNVKDFLDSHRDPKNTLTKKGIADVKVTAKIIAKNKIDLIFCSDAVRTKETAKIIAKATKAKIIVDGRLREVGTGKFEGTSWSKLDDAKNGKSFIDWADTNTVGVETNISLKGRTHNFMKEISEKYVGKNIVVVSHGAPLAYLTSYGRNISDNEAWSGAFNKIKTGGFFANDLARFHPTSVLETGYDILFFWVARMIMMTTYVLGEVPFKDVYLHGLVRDKDGDKMSKSKPETMIDPLPVAEKYGTDAVRLSLVIGTSAGNDFKLWEEKIAGFRNFTNKLWNIARFMIMNGAGIVASGVAPEPKSSADKWIMTELAVTLKTVARDINEYGFSHAGEALRDFTWGQLADWYLETAKKEIAGGADKKPMLSFLLGAILKMWHPFMPFVTETLWKEAGGIGLLMAEAWPKELKIERDWAGAHKIYEKEKAEITILRQQKAQPVVDPVVQAQKIKEEIQSKKTYIKNLEAMLTNKDFVKNAPSAVIEEKKSKLADAKEVLKKLEA